ncbi:PREDICTED: death-inducer obliterator 1-like [Chinchilla lanigera]|uniref:death-inducer obliterator 1-like n=1 Tax=Chinchilla lanigera TaxID=34839 RepID=UPI0006977453|nr:PREDICTED: death-inducer obliterator 1-like [Chinchilla lanigera]
MAEPDLRPHARAAGLWAPGALLGRSLPSSACVPATLVTAILRSRSLIIWNPQGAPVLCQPHIPVLTLVVLPSSRVTVVPGTVPCVGPGFSHVALPDTVYCSKDCILKHAAAAMRLLSAQKGHKPKPKKKVKMKPEELCLPKPSVQAGITVSSLHKRPASEETENPAKKVMATPSRWEDMVKEAASKSSTPSWARDHKASAMVPEKTAAPSPPHWGKCRCPPDVSLWAPHTLSG